MNTTLAVLAVMAGVVGALIWGFKREMDSFDHMENAAVDDFARWERSL